jgi:hypothetical protein
MSKAILWFLICYTYRAKAVGIMTLQIINRLDFKISKLAPKFISLFKITECIREAAYRLGLPKYHIRKGEGPELYDKGKLPKLAKNNKD